MRTGGLATMAEHLASSLPTTSSSTLKLNGLVLRGEGVSAMVFIWSSALARAAVFFSPCGCRIWKLARC